MPHDTEGVKVPQLRLSWKKQLQSHPRKLTKDDQLPRRIRSRKHQLAVFKSQKPERTDSTHGVSYVR